MSMLGVRASTLFNRPISIHSEVSSSPVMAGVLAQTEKARCQLLAAMKWKARLLASALFKYICPQARQPSYEELQTYSQWWSASIAGNRHHVQV